MRFMKVCSYIGVMGFGMMLAAMFEYGAQREIVFGTLLSLLITALSTFLYGTMKEETYETNYVQLS